VQFIFYNRDISAQMPIFTNLPHIGVMHSAAHQSTHESTESNDEVI